MVKQVRSTSSETNLVPVSELRAALNGRVISPDDPAYDKARTVFYGGIDRRPAAIVRADATAFAHRSSRIMVNVAAFYERPDEIAAREAWVRDFAAELRRGEGGAYVGFLGDEGEARIREAYPGATWERLAEIKRRYDPTNLFRLNQNVKPATDDQTTGQT